MRSFRARPVGWRNEPHRHYLASKGVKTTKYYRPEKQRSPYEGVSAFEVITGLRTPESLRVPSFPPKRRLTKSEQRERLKKTQEGIARASDIEARELMKEEPDYDVLEHEEAAVDQYREEQELAERGMEERLFGGRPLTKEQKQELMEEHDEARERNLKRLGIA